jgi:hypothetical protein
VLQLEPDLPPSSAWVQLESSKPRKHEAGSMRPEASERDNASQRRLLGVPSTPTTDSRVRAAMLAPKSVHGEAATYVDREAPFGEPTPKTA